MKKTLLLLLALATVATACQKTDEQFNTGKYPVITASISQDDTRISLDGTALQWTAGDLISIVKDGKTAVYRALSSGSTSEFEFESGEWGDGNGPMVAYYPATLAADGFASAYTSQAGELTSLPLRGEMTDANGYFTFRPFGGILKFNISKPADESAEIKLSRITITANEVIAGPFTDTTPSPESASAELTGTGKTITLSLAEPAVLTNEAKSFLIPVPALTYTSGLSVKFSCDNCLKTVVTTSDLTIERAHIQPISVTVSTTAQNDAIVRISTDGGASWISFDNLQDAVNAIDGDKANCKLELLKDYAIESMVTIGGKKFTWNGNGHTVSFLGKYPEITDNYKGGITINTDSEVDFTNTKFVGPDTGTTSTDRPFAILASVVSFGKDVTISDFKNSRPYGAAIWCNKQSVIYFKDNLKITNCHNAPASSSYGGGALCSDGSVYVQDDVLISGCSSAFWGGAILSNWQNETSMLIMSGNARIENCTSGKAGGAFYGNGEKIELSDNVTISNCYAGTYGGAFESRTVATLSDNVLIENCSAKTGGGAIYANTAPSDLTIGGDVRITGCRALAESGGAVRSGNTDSKLTIKDNATIDHCSAITEGGAIQISGTFLMTGNAKIDSCSCSKGWGGAIRTWKSATIEGNSTITKCQAVRGGAVADSTTSATAGYGQLSIKGNTSISGCSAEEGGAIHIAAKSAVISCEISESASISDNTASKHGNAIFTGMALAINGGTVSANASTETVYISSTGTMTIPAGSTGRFGNFGSGEIFLNEGTSSVSGGFYNKPIDSFVTIASGYKTASNDDANYVLKVVQNN